jgi:hypothetical protein
MVAVKTLRDGKEAYDALRVPEELPAAVREAVRHARCAERRDARLPWGRVAVCALASAVVVFLVTLNAVPALAQELYGMPVLGQMARVFTFWRYEESDEESYVRVRMPAIENTGNTALETRVNQEISLRVNEAIAEGKARAEEFYTAYLETGGDKDTYIPMEIGVDYEITCISDKVVSFYIYKYETQASFYAEYTYYNLDVESGKELTLADMLGEGYIEKVNEAVRRGIAADEAANPDEQYYHDELAFQTIAPDQSFYINDKEQVVVVFNKYAIAPGYMGMREFVVE